MTQSSHTFEAALRLFNSKQLDEAEKMCRRLVEAEPAVAKNWHLLGLICHRLNGRSEEAQRAVEKSIALAPTVADYHNTLGIILGSRGRHAEAIAAFRRALQIRPLYPEAINNLGVSFEAIVQLEEADRCYRQAISLKPDYAEAHNHLGNVLRQQGRLSDAIAAHREAVRLKPGFAVAHNNLAAALQEAGHAPEATEALRRRLELQPDSPVAHSELICSLLFDDALSPEQMLAEHRQWDRRHGADLMINARCPNDPDPNRRLRIGYVSPDFRDHPMPRFLLPILRNHDHAQFEIFCFVDLKRPDAVTDQIRSHVDHWRDLTAKDDAAAVKMIREAKIDLLVDLAGHMSNPRLTLFAHQPAPIQLAYLGYPSTAGLSAIQYRLTDAIVDPMPTADAHYTERLLRLDRCCWAYDPGHAPDVRELPASAAGHVTFAVLNRLAKVRPAMIRLWAEILKGVPNSRLFVLVSRGAEADPGIRKLFGDHGVPPERLSLIGRCDRQQYLALYNQVDISLDTFPYHGMTTTCDALWMGVPTITLAGNTCVSRTGMSILSAVDADAWIAQTPRQYVEIAKARASNIMVLCELRRSLRERMRRSSLLDHAAMAGAIENAYRAVWRACSP